MRWWRKLLFVPRRRQLDRELDEEIRRHLEQKTQECLEAGLSPEEARYAARRGFGNITLWKEVSREMWRLGSLETLWQDVRYGARMLARTPGFAAVAVMSLALGIGANAAIFTLIDTVLLRFLPVREPDRLALVQGRVSYPRFAQYRDRNEVFFGLFGAASLDRIRVDGSESDMAAGRLVSGNYFQVLGVNAYLGRTLTPDDDRVPGGHSVAVISYGYWQRRFAGAPGVVGRSVRLGSGSLSSGVGTSGFESGASKIPAAEGASFTIIGVTPPGFFGETVGQYPDLWLPMMMQGEMMPGRPWLTRKTANWVQLMGRLKPGVSPEQAGAAMTVLHQQLSMEDEGASLTEQQRRNIQQQKVTVQPGARGASPLRGQFSEPLWLLMGMVAVVLLIACANLTNLLLARATARGREFGVRLSLGAGRPRLVRQLFTESLLLALAGGAVGVLIAWGGSRFLVTLVAEGWQNLRLEVSPDGRILAFTAAVSVATALIFGLAPAVRAARVDVNSSLKEGPGKGSGRFRVARILVVAQVALSLVLLIGAGLFVRTLRNLKTLDLGYPRENIVMMRIDPVTAGYRDERISDVCQRLLERIRSLPGVKAATLSENGLFSGTESRTRIEIEGFTPASPRDMSARFDQVGPGYFTIVGIPILLGRDFQEQDKAGAARVAVINETMAKFYFANRNPIGRQIKLTAPDRRFVLEIVGVVKDAQDHNLRWEPVRRFYVSYYQPIDGITTANYEIRAAIDVSALAPQLRREVEGIDRVIPILHIKPLDRLIDESLLQERLVARLAGGFGLLAVFLAAVGLYGTLAYTVARRTREIGIRMAVGARRHDVMWLVLRQTLGLALAGVVVGVPAAVAATRLAEKLLYGLKSNDASTIAAAVVLLLLVAVAAALLPARRASRIDPIAALRYE
jgi:predicted permease